MSKKIIRHVRTPVGKFVKWLFIIFNFLMLLWLTSYWTSVGPMLTEGDQYSQTGAAIGSFLGTGMVLTVWVLGAVILGIPVLLTKGDLHEYSEQDLAEEKARKAAREAWTKPYIKGGLALLAGMILYLFISN